MHGKEEFRSLRTFREYTVLQAKLPVRTLTLTSNAFVIPAQSGMSTISEKERRLCISARTVKRPDLESEDKNATSESQVANWQK